MSFALALVLILVAIPCVFAVFFAWVVTPWVWFLVPGAALAVFAGVVAGASALAYHGHVAVWVRIAAYVGGGLILIAVPGMATDPD